MQEFFLSLVPDKGQAVIMSMGGHPMQLSFLTCEVMDARCI